MKQTPLGLLALGIMLVLSACSSSSSTPESKLLTVTPLSGPPGTVLTITGLQLTPEQSTNLELWVGNQPAPVILNEDGSLSAAIPLFLGENGWPVPPTELQMIEVRRGGAVLGRSAEGVTVTELPRAPGSAQEVQAALTQITDAYETLFSLIPPASEEQTPIREGVIAMLKGLVSAGEYSLQAVLSGTSPLLEGVKADTELVDALLASSGALNYFREYANALQGASAQAESALSPQTLSLYCNGAGEDFDLACQMQIYVVLDNYSRAFVKPTAETYANTVGLVSGLLAMGAVTVPAAAIVGAILSVADFIMEKIAPALFPSTLSEFELKMFDPKIEVGETTDSQIFVTAINNPPQISYLDLFEQIKTLAGLKNIDFSDKFYEVLKATAEFTLDLYLKIVKTYESSHPGTYSWVTAGDIRIPSMSWGPVEVKSERLVTLFSFDEAVVQSLQEELEWKGVKLGEATVRVMPRGPGEKSKVLRDHALCLGCVYSGGAFGNEMPDSKVKVIVGEIFLTATPHQGKAPLNVTFSWTGLEPQDEPLTCILDPGDGSTFYTIQDCANTTSQTHTYPYISVLESTTHSFEATLKVVGTEKTAATEVTVDWTFTATPAQGQAPLDVSYTWNIPYPADGGNVRCTLDPGDNSRTYSFENCLSTTTASHTYESQGSYVATLTIANAITQDTKTAPVSVSSCAGVNATLNHESDEDTYAATAWTSPTGTASQPPSCNWRGTAKATYSGDGLTEVWEVVVFFEFDPEQSSGDSSVFIAVDGSATWRFSGTQGECSYSSQPQTYPIPLDDGNNFVTGSLHIDYFPEDDTYKYMGTGMAFLDPMPIVTAQCPEGSFTGEYDFYNWAWLHMDWQELTGDGLVMQGSYSYPNSSSVTFEWHFER